MVSSVNSSVSPSLSVSPLPILTISSVTFRWGPTESEQVLSQIDLSVRQGEIYGLLGASGCGKTTLLRLILGQLGATSGGITLFGSPVGTDSRPTPLDIGYMPQDVVLYQEFTPNEMLVYFGRLYGMNQSKIVSRIDDLMQLLQLDYQLKRAKLIRHLSGGQKRRVSLAIALLHEPRLLILDEPTVGVDPLLREVIWGHLNTLTSKHSVTVILTTHYIEEARFAHTIGFLRNGRLLVQSSPESLLERYGVDTMEEVFLRLCRQNDVQESMRQSGTSGLMALAVSTTTLVSNCSDRSILERCSIRSSEEVTKLRTPEIANGDHLRRSTLSPEALTSIAIKYSKHSRVHPETNSPPTLKIEVPFLNGMNGSLNTNPNNNSQSKNKRKRKSLSALVSLPVKSSSNHFLCWPHLLTLMQKNFRQLRRNLSLLMFFILLPAIEIALIMLCIGRDIDHIPVAVFNGEKPEPELSRMFLESVPSNAFQLLNFSTPEEAYHAVEVNQANALLRFSEEFSSALRSRFFSFGFDDTGNGSLWNQSSIYVQLDMSNQLIGLQIQRQLLTGFLNFAQKLALSMGLGNDTFKPPIEFGPPVYGIQSTAVVETFIAPGALIMIAFFATTIVTCHLLIHEIRSALIERALIAGATTAEFLFSHIVIQSSILLVQLALMLLTAFRIFEMPYLGSLTLCITLITLQGLCGLMFGLMLSATCPDEIYATTLAIGTFFPSVIIGGIFWPVQSMPIVLQYLSHCMPSTQSIDALRSILLRRWGLTHLSVAAAFLVSTAWLTIFLVCALRNFKRRI